MATWRWYAKSDGTCCCGPCRNWSDNFDRSDSTDIGGSWNEVAGDWSIFTNQLKESGDGGHVIVTAWTPTQGMTYITVQMKGIQVGTKHRIIVGYRDVDNYKYAEFFYTGTPGAYQVILSLHKVVATVDTEMATETWDLGPSSLGDQLPLHVCYASDEFAVIVPAHEYCLWIRGAGVAHNAADKAIGLANGSGLPILFDDFYASDHWVTDHTCPRCVCRCDSGGEAGLGTVLPNSDLHITAIGDAGCECWSAVDDPMVRFGCMNWRLAPKTIDCSGPMGGTTLTLLFDLSCDTTVDGIATFLLLVRQYPSGVTYGSFAPTASLSTCVPLSLVFELDTDDLNWNCFGYSPHVPPIPIQFIITE